MNKGVISHPVGGRCGNVLFKSATVIAYALENGMPYTVPDKANCPKWHPVYLQHLAKIKPDKSLKTITIPEPTHAYHPIPFEEEWRDKNIIIDGWRQSEKYFKKYRDDVIAAFGFPWYLNEGVVGIHVRRGDYLKLKYKHHVLTKRGIETAMQEFPGMKFKFFSDDIAWCKSVFAPRDDCEFSIGQNEIEDLIRLSCCQHFIISQSTFGWWGAWLSRNPNKRIILNHGWFQPTQKEDTRDIVPDEWERVDYLNKE